MNQNAEKIQGMYAAFAEGNVPAVLGELDTKVSWTEAEGGPYGGVYTGANAVLENVFMRIGSEWDKFAAIPEEYVSEGDTVVALGTYNCTYKATGKSFNAPFTHVWKFRNGRVIAFQQYTDTAAFQGALVSD